MLRNLSRPNPDNVPVGVMARARRFAIIQLAREDAAEEAGEKEIAVVELAISCSKAIVRTWHQFRSISEQKGP